MTRTPHRQDLEAERAAAKFAAKTTHEIGGRWRKIAHILAALYIHEIRPEIAVQMNADDLYTVAKVAGVKQPSPESIALLRQTIFSIPKN